MYIVQYTVYKMHFLTWPIFFSKHLNNAYMMNRESLQSRPVSEVSPIKAELESIINNKIYESNESKQILITSRTAPDVHHSGSKNGTLCFFL